MLLRIEQERVEAKRTWGIHDRDRMSCCVINAPGTLVDLAMLAHFTITCANFVETTHFATCY